MPKVVEGFFGYIGVDCGPLTLLKMVAYYHVRFYRRSILTIKYVRFLKLFARHNGKNVQIFFPF